MQTQDALAEVIRQRTWDKELVLWVGSESKLPPLLASLHVETLDLLDLFEPDGLSVDDGDIRRYLSKALRQRLRSISRVTGKRTALIVRSAGLLARYRVGVQDFYDWFCDDFAMAILHIEGGCGKSEWPDEVECAPDRLVDYFRESGMIKRLIGT